MVEPQTEHEERQRREKFLAALDLQLTHCQKLLEAVTAYAIDWQDNGGRPFENQADVVLHAVFARSTRTYEAVVTHLGNQGFGEQATMLNRSLFEDMVDAHWIHLNPDLALERLRDHDRYGAALRCDIAARFPTYFGTDPPKLEPPMDDEERQRLVSLYGNWGDGSWTGLPAHQRWKAIETYWTSKNERRSARFFSSWIQRTNNETLHLSSYSLGKVGAPKAVGGRLHFRLGSTEELLAVALFAAFWTYRQTVALIFQRFAFNVLAELDAQVVEPGFAAHVSVVKSVL